MFFIYQPTDKNMEQFIKPPVEVRYSEELSALEKNDKARRPANWRLSPAAVRTFILGGDVDTPDGKVKIKRKFYGNAENTGFPKIWGDRHTSLRAGSR